MWASIRKVDFPKSFQEAIELQKSPKSAFFGGGSYLVIEKSASITKLIDINSLTDNSIKIGDNISIGAGATLQNILTDLSDYSSLFEATKFSCSSKNIRNQRTIGGEIAQKRIQSDLFSYLVALNPLLEIYNPDKNILHLRSWDGEGIINKIIINKIDLQSSGFERFATLDSAPAFLIVAVSRKALELDFVISGKARKIFGQTMNLADFGKNAIKNMINESVKYFKDDQYGSIEYKKSLVATGIQRAVEKIWK